MNTAMIAPVMMTTMTPDNYLARKDQYRKPARPKKKETDAGAFSMSAASYEPTDRETAMREFFSIYGR
ncbi:MAG: hypothetical protein K6G16_06040 [Lachnospiraceae bacterium]|nr:hypothetical protein [Lachnospiraceae bacterium]